MTNTIHCNWCNGAGRKYDPTNADKIMTAADRERYERCGRCNGTGQVTPSAPREPRQAEVEGVDYVPVSDDFWESWGI